MAVSVRMDPLLEKELAQAAKRRGITKSQFIVEAVERALGRNNPGELYLKVMEEMASYHVASEGNVPSGASDQAQHKSALRNKLRAKHTRESADYADFLSRQTPAAGGTA